jgi:hypothetical protein
MKKHIHNEAIIAYANGAEIESYMSESQALSMGFDMGWTPERNPTFLRKKPYRVTPDCEYALLNVVDIPLYKKWLAGESIQVCSDCLTWYGMVNVDLVDDPFVTWNLYAPYPRKKTVTKTQVRWFNLVYLIEDTAIDSDGTTGSMLYHYQWIDENKTMTGAGWFPMKDDTREVNA